MTRVLDSKTFVVLGEGLAAGVGHFSLTEDVQEHSFPALVAGKLGTTFDQPVLEAPGVGNVGFQQLPALVPNLLQTSVLKDFPRDSADLGNLSVPGFSVACALERRPKAPMVWTDDPQQTLTNMILGVPSLTEAGAKPPTQVEYAQARNPTLVLVALGYQEVLEPLVPGHIHGGRRADVTSFGKNYRKLVGTFTGDGTTVVVATIPNPLDTAYFSSLETAAHILRTEVPFLKAQYDLSDGDLISLDALVEIGYEFLARQVSGELPEGSVISTDQAAEIGKAVDGFNAEIRSAAEGKALVFDLHGYLAELAQNGVVVEGRELTADYLGGFYLLNGVFPGRTGHALIANQLIALLAEEFHQRIGEVDVAEVMQGDGNTQAKVAEGGTFTDEYLEPRTAENMPPLPPGDPSALNFFPPFDPKKFNIFPIQTTFPDSPFDFGGVKAINKCVPKVGIPAGGFSDPKIAKPLELPPGLEQTLDLVKDGSYFGDALRACDAPDEKPFINGLPTFGASGNTLFGGLAMTDSHLTGKIRIRFTEPDENGITHFEITHPDGLTGDDGVLAAPKFFKLPAQQNRVIDVPGLISSGDLDLATGYVTNFRYNVVFINTQIYTLFNVNPGLPPGPLPQIFPGPPNSGSTWARFDQREDGKLDITMAANLWLPLGKEGSDGKPIRFPLPFGNPDLQCASIVAPGTTLHPHIHLTTKEPPGHDLGDAAPEIPVNTVKEFTTFVHNNNFGDVFGLHIPELGGEGVGRSHLMGRLRFQFGPRCGDSVPFQVSFLPPGGLMSPDPVPLPYLPPGTSRGMIGFNEQLKYPSGVVYNQTLLSSSMDPNNLPLGMVDLNTGWVRGEFLNRSFVVQQLFVNLTAIEPCTPGDSFNYQGPARFEVGPGGELMFSSNGEVFIPYPKGFRFPSPSKDGTPPYTVVRESRLDPFLRLQAMLGGAPNANVLQSGTGKTPKAIANTSSIGEEFTYAFKIPSDPAAADNAFFEYTNKKDDGTFKLTRLSWVSATNSRASKAADGEADTITFGGFGTWSKDDDLHQVSVHISTAEDQPYVGIQVDGGTTSNVNTKPTELEDTIPIEAPD